ncbi:MAG TPA: SDR family oxidoreductase [Opitutaceae bacterium]|nr:SDR family oxidoreductase [Opitutaceae bacterium]
MRILFLGGTGIISTACSRLALERGHHVALLNRGTRETGLAASETIIADLKNESATRAALGNRKWDVVVNFIAFKPEDVERDIRLFAGKTEHYIFISSASAYQRPVGHYLVTESTPLVNPFWEYSRDKIACEERLMAEYRANGFPVSIIRPTLTYGDTQFVLPMNSWEKSYTIVDRMRRGLPVIVPGDGTSLWCITHNTDFAKGLVGLLGNRQAHGHAFHVTSDEVQTWDQYYRLTAAAAGVAEPKLVHIASDFIARCMPEKLGSLLGDKASSVVFDTSKIKRFVPDFAATTPFRVGVARTVAWYDADPKRRQIDAAANDRWDKLIRAYERGLEAAVKEFT